jgi:hypothetical protein
MKNLTVNDYVQIINDIDNLIINIDPLKDLKARKHNSLVKKKRKIIKIINDNIELAEQVYSILLKSENVETLITTSTDCLRIGVYVEQAISVLEKIESGPRGENRFNAMMILQIYRGEIANRDLNWGNQ